MSVDVVAVTGGNGFLGRNCLANLAAAGYTAVNLARGERREEVADAYVRLDLEDPGTVYSALATRDVDAVVHVGTIASPTRTTGPDTYRNNVVTTWNVLEAATELGLERVALASSVNAVGADFQAAPVEVEYLPVDEAHPATPRDPYGVAKRCLEVTAAGFGRLEGAPPVASLRFPWIADDEHLRSHLVEGNPPSAPPVGPGRHRRDQWALFTYVHVEDAVRACRLALEADYEGHELLWIVADDTTSERPSAELARETYPDATVEGHLEGHESLVSNERAARVLGWTPERSWRDLGAA